MLFSVIEHVCRGSFICPRLSLMLVQQLVCISSQKLRNISLFAFIVAIIQPQFCQHAYLYLCPCVLMIDIFAFFLVSSASGASVVAIDNKIEQAMVRRNSPEMHECHLNSFLRLGLENNAMRPMHYVMLICKTRTLMQTAGIPAHATSVRWSCNKQTNRHQIDWGSDIRSCSALRFS